MILIADSGSTKCDWIAVDKTGVLPLQKIRTKGLNPVILNAEALQRIISNSEPLKALQNKVIEIYFYGAGCGTPIPKVLLKTVLETVYPKAIVSVNEDTMAAIYATLKTTRPILPKPLIPNFNFVIFIFYFKWSLYLTHALILYLF